MRQARLPWRGWPWYVVGLPTLERAMWLVCLPQRGPYGWSACLGEGHIWLACLPWRGPYIVGLPALERAIYSWLTCPGEGYIIGLPTLEKAMVYGRLACPREDGYDIYWLTYPRENRQYGYSRTSYYIILVKLFYYLTPIIYKLLYHKVDRYIKKRP